VKLNEVGSPKNIPIFQKTLGQETADRQYQIFMDDNLTKIANELERQIKAGNVTATPSVATTTPTQQAQATAKPQSQIQPASSVQQVAQLPTHVKAAQQTLDKVGGQFSKLPDVAVQAATTRQQKQIQAMQAARAGMTNKPASAPAAPDAIANPRLNPIANPTLNPTANPAVWRSNRTESITFEKLNNLFENIINIDEAAQPMNISPYIQQLFIRTMNSPIFADPRLMKSLKNYADNVEKTYSIDKGQKALKDLVKFGYKSFKIAKSRTKPSTTLGNNTATAIARNPVNTATAIDNTIALKQTMRLLQQLDPQSKQQILKYLTKELQSTNSFSGKLDPVEARLLALSQQQGNL
jgi:hypothetical protein